jgi:hypothetical protein
MLDKKLLDTDLKYALSINKEGDSKKHYQFLGNATYISKDDTESYVANGGTIEKYKFTYGGESDNFSDDFSGYLKFKKTKDLNETTRIKLECEYLIAKPFTVDDYMNLITEYKKDKTFIACWKLPNKNTPTIYEQRLITTPPLYPIPKCRKIRNIQKERPDYTAKTETIPDITQKYFVQTEEGTYQVNEEVFAQEVYDPTKTVSPNKSVFSRFSRLFGPKKGGKRSKTRRTKRNRKSRFSRTKSS